MAVVLWSVVNPLTLTHSSQLTAQSSQFTAHSSQLTVVSESKVQLGGNLVVIPRHCSKLIAACPEARRPGIRLSPARLVIVDCGSEGGARGMRANARVGWEYVRATDEGNQRTIGGCVPSRRMSSNSVVIIPCCCSPPAVALFLRTSITCRFTFLLACCDPAYENGTWPCERHQSRCKQQNASEHGSVGRVQPMR
jgi:hypothetical protein